MLLHYFYTPVDVDGALDSTSENYRAIKELQAVGLIDLSRNDHGSWALTAKGEVMARYIMDTPLPQAKWSVNTQQHREPRGPT
jgi:hypothetical protein